MLSCYWSWRRSTGEISLPLSHIRFYELLELVSIASIVSHWNANWFLIKRQFGSQSKKSLYRYLFLKLLPLHTPVSSVQFSSVQFSRPVVSNSLRPHESQHARSPCPSPTPGVHSNSRPSSRRCHPATSSSVVPFSSCPQSLPASGSFPMSQLFTWGGQSIGVSALASVLPKNIQDWCPLEWTGWISLQSKGLSRVFSNTTVQKHQFFDAQFSSQSNSHIHTWPQEKP